MRSRSTAFTTSFNPPGKKGELPVLPRTNVRAGPEGRSRDVEVMLDVGAGLMTYIYRLVSEENKYKNRRTSTYPVTFPSNPVRISSNLVGEGAGASGSKDGTKSLLSH